MTTRRTLSTQRIIRNKYDLLAPKPGAYVSLADLRYALQGIPRQEVDTALAQLAQEEDIRLHSEPDQKTLTQEDRAAAIWLGGLIQAPTRGPEAVTMTTTQIRESSGSGRVSLAVSAAIELAGTLGLAVLAHLTGNPAVAADTAENLGDATTKIVGLFSLHRSARAERIAGYLVVAGMGASAVMAARTTLESVLHVACTITHPTMAAVGHPGIVVIAATVSAAANLLSGGVLSRAATTTGNDLLQVMAVDSRADVKAGLAVLATAVFTEITTIVGIGAVPAQVVTVIAAAWITWQIATGAWEAFTAINPRMTEATAY